MWGDWGRWWRVGERPRLTAKTYISHLAHVERAGLGCHRGLKAVEIVTGMVGGDGEESVQVGEHVRQREVHLQMASERGS